MAAVAAAVAGTAIAIRGSGALSAVPTHPGHELSQPDDRRREVGHVALRGRLCGPATVDRLRSYAAGNRASCEGSSAWQRTAIVCAPNRPGLAGREPAYRRVVCKHGKLSRLCGGVDVVLCR